MSLIKRGNEDTDVQREDHVKSQWEVGHLEAEERGLRRHRPCQHFDMGLLGARIVRKLISGVQATQSVVLCYCSPNRVIRPPFTGKETEAWRSRVTFLMKSR